MKTTYVYFGQKGYYYESDSSADQYVAGDSATSLTLAAAGMVPVDHTAGTANTGGGGGGTGAADGGTSGAGGSGIVILRYAI